MLTLPANGTVNLNADGTFQYLHNDKETQDDVFEYQVTDGGGNSHIVEIQVTVIPVNDNDPIIPDHSLTVIEAGQTAQTDGGSTSLLDGVIDTDPGDSKDLINVTDPANGTVNWATDGTFTYTHGGSEINSDSFSITVRDSAGNTATKIVSVTVLPANDPPQGLASYIELVEDTTYTFFPEDFKYIDGAEQNTLQSVKVSSLPVNGDLAVNGIPVNTGQIINVSLIASGALTYESEENLFGISADTIEFQVIDSGGTANGGSNTDASPETLTITILPVNDSPTLASSNACVDSRKPGGQRRFNTTAHNSS